MVAALNLVRSQLGPSFLDTSGVQMEKVLEDSSSTTPIIFLLSTGVDPSSYILSLARKAGFSNKLGMISLGQAQGPLAVQAIKEATKTGGWVCLQNCHLAVSWLPELEKLLDIIIQKKKINSSFR